MNCSRLRLLAATAAALLAAAAVPVDADSPVRSVRRPLDRVTPDRTVHPPAHRAALRPVRDCDGLRSHLVDATVESLVQYRYGWRGLPWLDGPDAGGGNETGPADWTETNVQEQGVDELDIVKTDGRHLYVTGAEGLVVVRSWPAPDSAVVATHELAGWPDGLFLHGDLAAAFSTSYGRGVGLVPGFAGTVNLELVDVGDRSRPSALRTIEMVGNLVGARMIDGHLFAVVSSNLGMPQEAWDLLWRDDLGLPEIPWDATQDERERAMETARQIFRPLVERIVDRLDPGEILPVVRDSADPDGDDAAKPLLGCGDLFAPPDPSTWSVLSVVHLDLDRPQAAPLEATGLLAEGYTVYASNRSLYIAQPSWWWSWWQAPADRMTTAIHRFDLAPATGSGAAVRYAATGEVVGSLLDQFAMSEHRGFLRVATTEVDWWWGAADDVDRKPANLVTVLHDDASGVLRQVGLLGGIAPGEQIYAVRFMGDIGYMVTFRQVDPLFTLDLSDPRAPRVVGELEVTGYSSYLHPVGEDHLLSVGMEADEEGRVIGLATSLFDVSDLSSPALLDRLLLEGDEQSWSWSEALSDHHAFTYHRGVLSIPAYVGATGQEPFSGLFVLSADPDTGIAKLGEIDHSDLPPPQDDPYGGFVQVRRSVYIDDAIYSLSNRGVKVNSLLDPEVELAQVPFYPPPGP